MHVLLSELPQARDVDVPAAFVAQALAEMPMRAALERPADDPDAGHANLHVELYKNDDEQVFARGRLTGWFEVACSRCIGRVRVPLNEELMATYMPSEQIQAADDEDLGGEDGVELRADDIDVFGYEDDVIDLEPLVREQLILAVPFAPLCSESCQGLCPQCGADRNREPCACEPVADPRWAALKNLKPDHEE